MTVGELIHQQAIKDGYNPEQLSPELKKVAESYQKVFESVREPMKAVYSMVETMQEPMRQAAKAASSVAEAFGPQMETIRRIQNSTSSIIPSSFYDEDNELILSSAFIRPVQEVRIINPEDIGIASAKRTNEYVIASYLLHQNATWESLDIQFIDGHFVKVSYPTMESKKFDFKDMGFINTKTNRPDLKWELLRKMADNNGALTNEKWDRKFTRNVKYELKERLMEFFGMEDSPIPHYTKKNGYRAKFSLRGDK
jgi:hypothetical protein